MIAAAPAQFSCVAGMMAQEVFETQPAISDACGASIAGHVATLEADFAAAIAEHGLGDVVHAADLALHTQVVLQGGFVIAKALDDPAAVVASIDHLRRYLMLLFKPGETLQ